MLLASVIGLQVVRERLEPAAGTGSATQNILYVQSPGLAKRAALSYDSLLADVYWVRAVQHYGRTRLSTDPGKQYDVLFPLLDLTTSLDPHFNIAYRFGAIFLAEAPPAGPGRPDQAVALLEKGLAAQPDRWEFAQDIGFVYYWWERDYARAADWFTRASKLPDAPNWMAPLAAVALSEGGNLETSRRLWQEIVRNSGPEEEWLRAQGALRLRQLDAIEQIAALERVVALHGERAGAPPQSWEDLVRAGGLRGIPVDPERYPYQLNPYQGTVTLHPDSPLNPLPMRDKPAA